MLNRPQGGAISHEVFMLGLVTDMQPRLYSIITGQNFKAALKMLLLFTVTYLKSLGFNRLKSNRDKKSADIE